MKNYLCTCTAILSVSLGASAVLAKPASVLPLRFNVLVVGDKSAVTFKELDLRAARYEVKDTMQIDDNVSLGQFKQPKDYDPNYLHQNPKGFGFKGRWRF